MNLALDEQLERWRHRVEVELDAWLPPEAASPQRLHARGPMGLRELTTYKWIARGDYHLRP